MLDNVKKQIIGAIEKSLKDFPRLSAEPTSVTLEIPSDKSHGDLCCTIALRLAGILKQDPFAIASSLKESFEKTIKVGPLKEKIQEIQVKRPGFLNFFLSRTALYDILYEIFKADKDFGKQAIGKNQKLLLEFVSANPTGPLSVAHARQAAVGDALANVLHFAGFEVKREFYINDEGNQINILGRSIELRARDILGQTVDFPEDHYQGDYIRDMAKEFVEDHRIRNVDGLAKFSQAEFSKFGVDYLLAVIRKELEDFGVHFDNWSS